MHDGHRNSATSTTERCLKTNSDQNFQLPTSIDVKKNSSGETFMPISVQKVVVGKREGKGQLERLSLRGEIRIKMNLKYCK
jgi:hypothetical protein